MKQSDGVTDQSVLANDGCVLQPPFCCEFRIYRRPLQRSLRTHHGDWQIREGILLRLTSASGQVSYGEIAPLPWFGSETLEQAQALCQQMPAHISLDTIQQIPDTFPACQFGFESALLFFTAFADPSPTRLSALLPTGERALTCWSTLWQQGYRTFKWKIGVADIATELTWLEQLLEVLPPAALLRLDANGGLTDAEAETWLQTCDRLSSRWRCGRLDPSEQPQVEYLEQPLPPGQFLDLLHLSQTYQTPIALDESVATLAQLRQCYAQGWRSIVVIKPAIAGFPSQLQQFCQTHPVDAVFSSVLETAIARSAGLYLAQSLANPQRALGYGTQHWFRETDPQEFESLWQSL